MQNAELGEFEHAATKMMMAALAKYGICEGEIEIGCNETSANIAHDRRGAPYAVDEDGLEDKRMLVSFSDEDGISFCAWARKDCDSPVAGLGADVVLVSDFEGKRGNLYKRVLFTEGEHELVREAWDGDENAGYAFAFGAKEAAFKALSAPLRRWYETHDELLPVEVRSFELLDWEHEAGTARRGEGARAMDALGIGSIELCRVVWGDYALTCAIALKG